MMMLICKSAGKGTETDLVFAGHEKKLDFL